MSYRGIDIYYGNDCFISTRGLNFFIENEIRLKSFGNKEGELALLYYLIDYSIDGSPTINDDETITYGLWLLKFTRVAENFEIYELDELFVKWNEGADNAIYYFEQQKILCMSESAKFNVPLFTQNIAISKGVLEGLRVQGIRYNEPPHMSGWYLTTSEYDGNIENMKVVSLQTLVINRKDILQFLALPPGFVFEITENETCRIWKAPVDVSDN
jgi:hypothetical protein